jgi:hypothetical protein
MKNPNRYCVGHSSGGLKLSVRINQTEVALEKIGGL